MVKAILEGRKSQTRRMVKPALQDCSDRHKQYVEAEWKDNSPEFVQSLDGGNSWYCRYCGNGTNGMGEGFKSPYGLAGDILYVRETFCWDWLDYPDRTKKYYVYKASTPDYVFASGEHWLPSIHMPKEAARLFLKITDIRVERLQDISETDAEAEGVEWRIMGKGFGRLEGLRLYKDYINPSNTDYGPIFAKDSFSYLWQSINGPESWDANPWCWCINFERIEKHFIITDPR